MEGFSHRLRHDEKELRTLAPGTAFASSWWIKVLLHPLRKETYVIESKLRF
jgi:hypothetical protein